MNNNKQEFELFYKKFGIYAAMDPFKKTLIGDYLINSVHLAYLCWARGILAGNRTNTITGNCTIIVFAISWLKVLPIVYPTIIRPAYQMLFFQTILRFVYPFHSKTADKEPNIQGRGMLIK